MADKEVPVFFHYPSVGIGGAQIFLVNLATMLAENGYTVGVFSDSDSFIRNELVLREIVSLEIRLSKHNGDSKYHYDGEFVLVTTLNFLFSLSDLISLQNCRKVVLLDMHPSNVIGQLPFGFLFRSDRFFFNTVLPRILFPFTIYKTKKILEEGIASKSIGFLCGKDFEMNRFSFRIKGNPSFVPIPIKVKSQRHNRVPSGSNLNILWVSRLDLDKVRVLNLLISDISVFNSTKRQQINLHVVGDGSAKNRILNPSNVEINYHGILYGDELTRFALTEIDCSFGVGTSALETSALGVPTFLIPSMDEHSYYAKRESRYLSVSEITDFDVAVEKMHSDRALSFESAIRSLIIEGAQLGSLCRDHVLEHHNIGSIWIRFEPLLFADDKSKEFVRTIENTRLSSIELVIYKTRLRIQKLIRSLRGRAL